MRVLVVGGAGFIGSQMVKLLHDQGCDVVVLDDLSTGHADAVIHGKLITGDFGDPECLRSVFDRQIDAVMHLGALSRIEDSVRRPDLYYDNNVVKTLRLLDVMRTYAVHDVIFSSSASVFGEPKVTPIDEDHPRDPLSPYGWSKLMVEALLGDYDTAFGLKSVILRYFNAAGADPDGVLGERHQPETHLIPLVLQVASGRRENISIFGEDYDTEDGTCVRDFVHVEDICRAHWLALQTLRRTRVSRDYNLGSGMGFSVRNVIDVAARVTGRPIPVIHQPRRPGDPARLIADSRRARQELGWTPRYPSLEDMISHAWAWERKLTTDKPVANSSPSK